MLKIIQKFDFSFFPGTFHFIAYACISGLLSALMIAAQNSADKATEKIAVDAQSIEKLGQLKPARRNGNVFHPIRFSIGQTQRFYVSFARREDSRLFHPKVKLFGR
jgi:hypothetical protein